MVGLKINSQNDLINEWGKSESILIPPSSIILSCPYFDYTQNSITGTTSNNTPSAPSYTGVTRGYFPNEVVEGGDILIINSNKNNLVTPYVPHNNDLLSNPPSFTVPPSPTKYYFNVQSFYKSPSYSETQMSFGLGTSGKQIIMRSDRLPTSTCVEWNKCSTIFNFP